MKKTILHTIDTTGPGGAETIFLNLVANLRIEGYRNIALIKGPGWVEEQLKKRNIEYFILHPYGFLSIPYYLALILFFKKNQVALVQAHLLGSVLTFSIVCRMCNVPLIATLHGQVDINPQEKFVFIKQWLMRTGVNKLVAVSRNLAEFIQNRGLFHQKNIEIIYNGVDTSRYYRSNQNLLKSQLGIDPKCILVGSLGNVRPAKNYDLLIKAAAIFKRMQSDREVHFVIAGHQRKDLMKNLNALATEYDVTSTVHFLGFLDDTPKFLSELDLFLLCSSSEGFSIATIEAMAAGVAVIATRCGGPEEIITDDVSGILIETNNAKKIAEIINVLLVNPEKQQSLIKAAQKHVESTFSLSTMFKRYSALYSSILEKHTTPV